MIDIPLAVARGSVSRADYGSEWVDFSASLFRPIPSGGFQKNRSDKFNDRIHDLL